MNKPTLVLLGSFLASFAGSAAIGCTHPDVAGAPPSSPGTTVTTASEAPRPAAKDAKVLHVHAHLDQNHDGVLEVAELGNDPRLAWARAADVDHDGVVTVDELIGGMLRMREAVFARVDANGDGVLTAAELGEEWAALKIADVDGSGSVSLDELVKAQRPGGVEHLNNRLEHAASLAGR
jgi:Ca2+-binding EF-hand superfamily protein